MRGVGKAGERFADALADKVDARGRFELFWFVYAALVIVGWAVLPEVAGWFWLLAAALPPAAVVLADLCPDSWKEWP